MAIKMKISFNEAEARLNQNTYQDWTFDPEIHQAEHPRNSQPSKQQIESTKEIETLKSRIETLENKQRSTEEALTKIELNIAKLVKIEEKIASLENSIQEGSNKLLNQLDQKFAMLLSNIATNRRAPSSKIPKLMGKTTTSKQYEPEVTTPGRSYLPSSPEIDMDVDGILSGTWINQRTIENNE
jgi:predicted  nucleic acid-binding Zn-ribbon protein